MTQDTTLQTLVFDRSKPVSFFHALPPWGRLAVAFAQYSIAAVALAYAITDEALWVRALAVVAVGLVGMTVGHGATIEDLETIQERDA